jgi:hypothetical protein
MIQDANALIEVRKDVNQRPKKSIQRPKSLNQRLKTTRQHTEMAAEKLAGCG